MGMFVKREKRNERKQQMSLMEKRRGKIILLFLLAVFVAGFFAIKAGAQEAAGTTLMYALDTVNVRKGPGTETDVIGELEQGETIFAVELTPEGWYRVVYGGETGYVREDFLAVYGEAGDSEEYAPSDAETFFATQPYYDPEQQAEPAAPKIRKVRPVCEETGEEKTTVSDKTKKSKRKINISTIVIFVLAIGSILVYGTVQIVMEKNGGENLHEITGADEEMYADEETDADEPEQGIEEETEEEIEEEMVKEAEKDAAKKKDLLDILDFDEDI